MAAKESDVFLITGSRKGLGYKICTHFLERNHCVIGCSRGDSSIEHPNYSHYCLDISNECDVSAMVRDVRKKHGKIGVLINNAGIASMNHFVLTPYSTAQKIVQTNFLGTFLLCREVSKVMIKQKGGRIVNFSTVAAPLSLEGESVYAASKMAVENFTRTIAGELGEYGITVNAIGPTPIDTDLIRHIPREKIDELIARQRIKRMGTCEDLLNVIDFFVDRRSSFITAQTIWLGGIVN